MKSKFLAGILLAAGLIFTSPALACSLPSECPSGQYCVGAQCVDPTTLTASKDPCNSLYGIIECSNPNVGRYGICIEAETVCSKSTTGPLCSKLRKCAYTSLGNTAAPPTVVDELKIRKPLLEINWPGLNFSDVQNLLYSENGSNYIRLPWLGQFAAAVYSFGLGVASILAVVMIVVQGARVITSGGGEAKTQAYKRIAQAVAGLIIVWGSFFILNTINPKLTQFSSLRVNYVEPQSYLPPEDSIPSEEQTDSSGSASSGTDQKSTDWQKIIGISGVTTNKDLYALPAVIAALKQAAADYKGGGKITITEAGRSADYQYTLMIKMCGCPPVSELPKDVDSNSWGNYCSVISQTGKCDAAYKNVGRVSGVFVGRSVKGHLAGNALDASTGKSTIPCSQAEDDKVQQSRDVVNTSNYPVGSDFCVSKTQQQLIKAMLKNGFCVGLKSSSGLREPWHFELTTTGIPVSSFCVKDFSDPNLQKLYYAQN